MNRTQNGEGNQSSEEVGNKMEGGSNQRSIKANKSIYMVQVQVLLRAAALGLTVAAAVVMATAKQTTTVRVQVSAAFPPLRVPVTAKSHYLSAFSFFVVANAIACAYAGISLLLTILKNIGGRSSSLVIIISDILIMALLFSGNGAASAVGLLGREGNSHVHWNKVCNVFGEFCNRVMAAIILSLLASLSFFLVLVVAVFGLPPTYNH